MMSNGWTFRLMAIFFALTLSMGVTHLHAEENNQEEGEPSLPFDLPLVKYGDLQIGAGYYFHYDRDFLRDLMSLGPSERIDALNERFQRVFFEHLLAQQAIEQGYDRHPDFIRYITSMEIDWLSRFFIYHHFEKDFEADEDTLKAMYEERVDEYYRPLSFSFRHIFFQTRDRTEEEVVAAHERAKIALALIRSGSEFIDVANEFDESDRQGAVIGPFNTREHDPEKAINPVLEEALLDLQPGAYSDVVESRHGYHILWLESLQPAHHTPFANVRASLAQELRSKLFEEFREGFLREHWDRSVSHLRLSVFFDEDEGDDAIVAVIMEKPITKGVFSTYLGGMVRQRSDESDEAYRERIDDLFRNNFIFRALASEIARQQGYDEIPGYQLFTRTALTQFAYREWATLKQMEYLEENPITEEMLLAFYDENPQSFLLPQQSRISVIVVPLPEHDADDRYEVFRAQTEAREKAQSVIERLEAGEDFAALAEEISLHDSAARGGDLGFIDSTTELIPATAARRAMRLAEGEIVEEPFRSGDAFYIMKCVEKPDRETRPFEDPAARDIAERSVGNRLRNEYFQELFASFIDPERIEILYDGFNTLDPHQLEQVNFEPPERG